MMTRASCERLDPLDLTARQDAPVDQGDLGAHRKAHGRDEAQHEDGAVPG